MKDKRTHPRLIATIALLSLSLQGSFHPAGAQDKIERKTATEIAKDREETTKADQCLHILSLYRGLLASAGKNIPPLNAIVDTTSRHNTLQRLLTMAWMLQCDITPHIDAEAEKLGRLNP